MAQVRKYDDDQPRAENGEWSAGGGGGGAAGGSGGEQRSAADHERATASLQDASFVTQHMSRLSAAGDEVRAAHAPEERATDAVHNAAQTAIHTEAMRIHAESDAAAGPDRERLESATRQARYSAKYDGQDLAGQHAAVLAAVEGAKGQIAQEHADRQSTEQALAAGHVTADIPHAAEDHFGAEHERIVGEINATRDSLDEAHATAADAIGKLQAMGTEADDGEDWSEQIDKVGIDEEFDATSGSMATATGAAEREEGFSRSDHHEEVPFPTGDMISEPDPGDRPTDKEEPKQPPPFEHDPHATPEENDNAEEAANEAHELWKEEHSEWQGAREEYDASEAEYKVYEAAVEQHATEFKARADVAQTALEALHEKQIAAAIKLPELEKAHDKANEARQKEVEDLHDHALVNHAAVAHDPAAQERAQKASELLLGDEGAKRTNDERTLDLEDARSALKDEMRSTVDAIKQLSKVTGREPRIPAKQPKPGKTKKSGSRWQQSAIELLKAIGVSARLTTE